MIFYPWRFVDKLEGLQREIFLINSVLPKVSTFKYFTLLAPMEKFLTHWIHKKSKAEFWVDVYHEETVKEIFTQIKLR